MRKKISCIYTITNKINNKVYVGRSIDYYTRKCTHKKSLERNCHKNEHLQAAWNKYGKENFEFDVLEKHDPEFLPSMEHWWCNMLNTYNRKYGYNTLINKPNGSHSIKEETREKLRISQLGRKHTEESKKRMSVAKEGKKQSEEYIEKRISKIRGKKRSKEAVENMKLGMKNGKKPNRTGQNNKKIYVYTMDDQLIGIFPSLKELTKVCNFSVSKVSECCNGHKKSFNNLKFYYNKL